MKNKPLKKKAKAQVKYPRNIRRDRSKTQLIQEEKSKRYDLEERTAKFGEDIIEFAKKVPRNVITLPLIGQLVKAGTSVGANYLPR